VGQFSTAATIINRAAVQLGLAQADDPFASTDPATVRLCELLSVAGQELAKAHRWPHLRGTLAIARVQGQTLYPLPADFGGLVPETLWNSSGRLPGVAMSPQEWAFAQARLLGSGQFLGVRYRIAGSVLELLDGPPATITLDYESSFWVQSGTSAGQTNAAGQPAGDKDVVSSASDLVLFPTLLAIRALKLQFLQAAGFDTAAAAAEYDQTLRQEQGRGQGQTLSLNRRYRLDRFLDERNLPDLGTAS
jgi:hypothetical protein